MNNQTKAKRGRKPLPPDQRKIEVKVWVKPDNVQKIKDFAIKLETKTTEKEQNNHEKECDNKDKKEHKKHG